MPTPTVVERLDVLEGRSLRRLRSALHGGARYCNTVMRDCDTFRCELHFTSLFVGLFAPQRLARDVQFQ